MMIPLLSRQSLFAGVIAVAAMCWAVPSAQGQGLDPDIPAEQQLAGAIDSGSLVAVRRMLEAGADPDRPYDGATPLVRAIVRGKSYVVRLLCQHGAKLDARDSHGWTPLFWAAERGETKIARQLMERGANAKTLEGRHLHSPLHVAAAHGHLPLVELLLERGSPLAHRDRFGGTALDEAAFGGHADVVSLLVKQGLAVEWPLHVAAGLGNRQRVEKLLDEGAEVNAPTRGWKNSPLAYAVGGGQLEVARLLVEQGADVDTRNVAGATPLHIAAGHGRVEIAQWLIEQDESLRAAVDNEGLTPLDWSRTGAIKQLLEPKGTASDQRSPQGSNTARSGTSG
jgi:ankyrin repeat protein